MILSRIKLDTTSVVNVLLDCVDQTLFERDDTTFLDPAMAGGQFLKAVEDRLRSHGHSDENISNRVASYITGTGSIFNWNENENDNEVTSKQKIQ